MSSPGLKNSALGVLPAPGVALFIVLRLYPQEMGLKERLSHLADKLAQLALMPLAMSV